MFTDRRLPIPRRKLAGVSRIRRMPAPGQASPFKSNDDLLEAARQMFAARSRLIDTERNIDTDDAKLAPLMEHEKAWTEYWHASFDATGDDVDIVSRCRKADLDRIEREIVILLVLNELKLVDAVLNTPAEIIDALGFSGVRAVGVLRKFFEGERLFSTGFIRYGNPDDELSDREVLIDPTLPEIVLYGTDKVKPGWPVKTEKELFEKMAQLTRLLQKKVSAKYQLDRGIITEGDSIRLEHRIERLIEGLDKTLVANPDWNLGKFLRAEVRDPHDRIIVLALLGKALGHLPGDEDLFSGRGLVIASTPWASQTNIDAVLGPDACLVREEIVQPVGGNDEFLMDNPDAVSLTEFELTDRSIEAIGIEKQATRYRPGIVLAREPGLSMKQLVLSDKVRQALEMAISQARNSKVLMEEWGLGETIQYGKAVTLLFSGPPGVGKTACAEALAQELGKKIVVADYSRIQNCFVGNTEKNIVSTFRQAMRQGAVLFWDEADAMFFDRDFAMRTWETRDVNVLLQEIERFDGVCILATNRKVSLDKALERRISLKVEFERPDEKMRRAIWERLIPKKMPLSDDVSLDELARTALTGGEIKNVVLNAARMALKKDGTGKVTMSHFKEALAIEMACRWNENCGRRLGFVISDGVR